MKKYIFILATLTLMAIACKKSEVNSDCYTPINLQLQPTDEFIIGSSGGFGGGGLGTYKIKNGQLFKVSTSGDSLLSNERFLKAKAFTTAFPKELKDAPNQNWRTQCNDTFIYYVEWKTANGTEQSWYFDDCPSSTTPQYAKCFFEAVKKEFF